MDWFIVDFYCHEIMLAIEVDGSSHDHPYRIKKDKQRQERLESFGVRFVRIRNREVLNNMDGVLRFLQHHVDELVKGLGENE